MWGNLTVRNLSSATQRSCVNVVSKFSRYFRRSSDHLGLEHVHAFQVHLTARGTFSRLISGQKHEYLRRLRYAGDGDMAAAATSLSRDLRSWSCGSGSIPIVDKMCSQR
jgi:hypothetical protein